MSAGTQTDWFAQNAPPIPTGSSGAPKAPSTAVSSIASPQAIPSGQGDDWFSKNAPTTPPPSPAQPETGVWEGVKRNTVGMVAGLYHALTDPATDQEKQELLTKLNAKNAAQGMKLPDEWATDPNPVQLAYHRLVDAPGDELSKKGKDEQEAAKDLLAKGETWKGGNMYASGAVDRLLSVLPGAGPWLNSVAQRVESGDVSGAATDVASAAALSHAPEVLKRTPVVGNLIGKLQAPLGETVTAPRGTIPAESFSPAEIKSYADANGIDLNAAQATGHNLPRSLQSAGERAAVGGTAIRKQIASSQAALTTHAEGLMDQFSPKTPDVASAGRALQSSVQEALDRQLTVADQNYSKVDEAAQGTTVDLKSVKAVADSVLADSDILRKAGLDPKTATRVLKGLGELDDDASFKDAQKLRSALLDLSRSPELAISTTAQGMLKQVIGATDAAMMDAAKETPELQKAFRGANAHYEQIQNDFNSPRSPMNQILSEPDPNKVPQKLTQRGQTGGSPYNAQLLDTYGIDKGPLKRVIMDDLVGKDYRLWNKNLGGYSDDFLRSVFDKAGELDHVYKTSAIGRSLGLNTNPSGTAAVQSAIEQTGNPYKAAKQSVMAKLTNSPHFNKWLMEVTGQPLPSTPRAAGAVMLTGGRKQAEE